MRDRGAEQDPGVHPSAGDQQVGSIQQSGAMRLLMLQRLAGNRAVTSAVEAHRADAVQRAKTKAKVAKASPAKAKPKPKANLKPTPKTKAKVKAKAKAKQKAKVTGGGKGGTGAIGIISPSGTLTSRSGIPLYGHSEFGPLGPLGYATGMHVTLLDWNHTPEGRAPSVKPPWWPTGDAWWSKYMVQGHLLNDNLGGPGNSMRNLAPISKTANSDHLHQVETLAKTTVITHGRAVAYDVTVLDGPPPPGSFAPYENDTSQPNRHLIANLPKGFECQLHDDDGNLLVAWTVVNRL